ncbi:Uncharacterised protein [Legionella steigerwaltii]|uniref:Uncharacterized protein n=1 Tax=Legionella steigerwaltii TaxID=460 RepID=A0A378L9R9_9GAMM|nr:hypothetical protein [Legionella steigerwaltii]KTD72051.1 hypothetical protein Lstg_2669 [Legionella steigerwaltii]STY22459.1 Uncharacterised protein [Legionella steigerwaltii]
MGGYLERFINKLREGRAHGGRGGEEYNAGSDANIGIIEFAEFIDNLTEEERTKLFACTIEKFINDGRVDGKPPTDIGVIWERLRNPGITPTGERQTFQQCVEVNGSELAYILRENQELLMGWTPKFAQDTEKTDNKRIRLDKEIDKAEKNLLSLIEGKRIYSPTISYGEESKISLLSQLIENEDKIIVSLIKNHPYFGIGLRLQLHDIKQGSLNTIEALDYQKRLEEIVTSHCPSYETTLNSVSTLREILLQLPSNKDKIELLKQLNESLLTKLIPDTNALLNLISEAESGKGFNSESKLSVINFFFEKEYFKPAGQNSSEVVRFLKNCNIAKLK